MKFRIAFGILSIAACSLGLVAQKPDKEKVIAGAERAFEKTAKTNLMPTPGCAVGVSLNGEPVFEKAFGMAEMEHGIPNTAQTIFESASISKQFTAAALVLLQQDGKLNIDDNVRKYIPELPDYGKPLTIRHMLNHTAGLRNWASVMALTGLGPTDRVVSNAIAFDVQIRQKHLDFTPGSEYSYSNSGYLLAAIVVERVSKQKLADFVSERIFKPLGMTKSSWRDDHRRLVPLRAQAYTREGSPGVWTHNMRPSNVVGSAGLQTTVGDLLKWNASLDAKTFGEPFVNALETQGVLIDGRRIIYALGLQVGKHEGLREVHHDGQQDGYRSYLTRFPEKGLSFAVLCNTPTPDAIDVVDAIFEEIFGPFPKPEIGLNRVVTEEQLRKHVGLWKNNLTRFTTRVTLDKLELKLDNDVLEPTGDDSFIFEDSKIKFIGGSPPRAEVTNFDGSVTRLTRVDEWNPDRAELAKFVGDWRSDEAQATMKFTLEGNKLFLVFSPFSRIEIKPTSKDHFSGGTYVVWFTRDTSGKITQMHVGRNRLRDMVFERLKK